MAKYDRVPLNILATRLLPSAHPDLIAGFITASNIDALSNLQVSENCSLAMFTADCDDVGYIAIDEATKQADVRVLYAGSFYAGAGNASMPWSGEFIGILAGRTPSDASAGLNAAITCYEQKAAFTYADDDNAVIFLDHTIAAAGIYLSQMAGVEVGTSLAYLIAPPLEASYGLDAALKAANVRLAQFYPAPTPTNFAGALLSGYLSDCRSACAAFRESVIEVAKSPRVPV